MEICPFSVAWKQERQMYMVGIFSLTSHGKAHDAAVGSI